jgi:curved DNA-binding protein CbpA
MASPDLYAILGISRDADAGALKAAYRQRAKAAHPDHGSDAEVFRRLKDAYDILSDPALRAHYDATGETPADKAAREADEARFRQLLGDLLVATIARAGAPAFTDIIAEARRSLVTQIAAADSEMAGLKNLSDRIAQVLERLQEPDGETLLRSVLSERKTGLEDKLATVTELRAQLMRLLEGLKYYGYTVQLESLA